MTATGVAQRGAGSDSPAAYSMQAVASASGSVSMASCGQGWACTAHPQSRTVGANGPAVHCRYTRGSRGLGLDDAVVGGERVRGQSGAHPLRHRRVRDAQQIRHEGRAKRVARGDQAPRPGKPLGRPQVDPRLPGGTTWASR